jgi:hypothetical protein
LFNPKALFLYKSHLQDFTGYCLLNLPNMSKAGESIFNSEIGDDITWLETTADTPGKLEQSVAQPVHLNWVLREHGYLSIQEESGRERLDAATSQAFSLAHHRLAYVYVNDLSKLNAVRQLLEQVPGVEKILGADEKAARHLDHPRAGELVVLAAPDTCLFDRYWLDEAKAPDAAQSVDRHCLPSYDPVDVFTAAGIKFMLDKLGLKPLGKKLGFRMLMNIIALDATLVKGLLGH